MGRSGAIVVLSFLMACSNVSEDLIKRAGEVHDLSVKISEHVENKIDAIEVHALSTEGVEQQALLDSVTQLNSDLAEWRNNLIEVPGHEHHHDHNHNHGHHHQSASGLTPQMILEIQREINQQIIQLNIRSQRILDEFDNHLGVEL